MFTNKPLLSVLLVLMLAILPAYVMGQTYNNVTVSTGSQSFTGYTVTVSPDGAPGVGTSCSTGPFFIGVGGVPSGYIFTLNNPASYARVQIYGLNDNEVAYFKVNGSVYPVSNSFIVPYTTTCTSLYTATIVSGNLTSSGDPVGSTTQSNMQVTIHPSSNFTTFEVYYTNVNGTGNYGDGCYFNFAFAGTCTSVLSTPDTSVCTGHSIALPASNIPGASYTWNGPNSFSSSSVNPVLNNVQTSQGGTYSVSASFNGCTYSSNEVLTVNQSPIRPVASSNSPVCSGNTLTLNMTSIGGVTYGWTGPAGFVSSSQNFNIANASAVDSGDFVASDTATNGCISYDTIFAVIHQSIPAPNVVVYSTVGDTICTSGTVLLKTNVTNGTSFSYQWYKNFNPIPGATGSSYTANNVSDKDLFYCFVTSTFTGCQVPDTATSGAVTIRVIPVLGPPTVNISASPSNYTTGTLVTFTASAAGGGVLLTFQWMKNGSAIVGATTSTYQTTNVAPGDKIWVVVTSGFPCASPTTASSNTITVAVPEVAAEKEIHLYPNPTTGSFTLTGAMSLTADAQMEVTDASGKIVYRSVLPASTGSVHEQIKVNAVPGNYMLSIKGTDGNKNIPFTIVK